MGARQERAGEYRVLVEQGRASWGKSIKEAAGQAGQWMLTAARDGTSEESQQRGGWMFEKERRATSILAAG